MRPGADSSGRPLEADEASDERVVARVGGVAVALPQEEVEALLRLGQSASGLELEAAKPRGSDRDEQRLDRLDPILEIAKASPNDLSARQALSGSRALHGETVAPQ